MSACGDCGASLPAGEPGQTPCGVCGKVTVRTGGRTYTYNPGDPQLAHALAAQVATETRGEVQESVRRNTRQGLLIAVVLAGAFTALAAAFIILVLLM